VQVISGGTRLVALLGHPVAHSLSPRMQNAAFAARGLDWAYVACDVEAGRVADAIEGLVALGFAGANVTVPYKQEAAAIADDAEGDAVNTLVFDRGRVLGFNTDKEILAGVRAQRAAVIGAGGAARALLPALDGDVRIFSRRGDWPPVTDGCDVVVHATPIVDELLFEPRAGQTVVDLAYRGDGRATAIVEAARAAGAEVIDGLEALVRQGAASFERWTGVPAPVSVMRTALAPLGLTM
jgi:shikimate dehydrogenase